MLFKYLRWVLIGICWYTVHSGIFSQYYITNCVQTEEVSDYSDLWRLHSSRQPFQICDLLNQSHSWLQEFTRSLCIFHRVTVCTCCHIYCRSVSHSLQIWLNIWRIAKECPIVAAIFKTLSWCNMYFFLMHMMRHNILWMLTLKVFYLFCGWPQSFQPFQDIWTVFFCIFKFMKQ